MSAPELSAEERATVERFEAAPDADESFDATAALQRVLALVDGWEASSRSTLRGPLSPAVRAMAHMAIDQAWSIRAAVAGE